MKQTDVYNYHLHEVQALTIITRKENNKELTQLSKSNEPIVIPTKLVIKSIGQLSL